MAMKKVSFQDIKAKVYGLYNKRIKNKYVREFVYVIWKTIDSYGQHNCPVMAAGMSFFGIMSLIPMALISVSVLGYILGSSETAQKYITDVLSDNFPSSAKEILDQIYIVITSPNRDIINGIGLVGLIWSSMRFFNILQSVLNSIWVGAKQRWFIIARAIAFLIFVASGILFWASFLFRSFISAIRGISIAGVTFGNIGWLWWIFGTISSLIASIIMLFLVYMFVPHAKVSIWSALIGSGFSAIVIEITRWAFSHIVLNFTNYGAIYGPLAGLIIFMTWLYISMQVLLMGAELGSQCQSRYFNPRLKQRGV